MPMPTLAEVTNYHYLEWLVMENEAFKGTVELAMIAMAFAVYGEDPETPNHKNRVHIALNLVNSDVERERLRPLFAARVIQDGVLRPQVFDLTTEGLELPERVKPWRMDGIALAFAIGSVWDVAAGISQEGMEG